ncbi:MAG: choice-of-anchor I family protein [Haliscomenobacter sp.]|uniref:choice-of-anchor I family protein n=1 Tax=Haliscomenobacter sp. TaxID=2717303 RepID=UPI0029A7DCB6|nr:choice-of-anchor I family protein [Haliscomenobacter sp.]MDX2071850.1 choice-of-anchor I family protein [Haliscomenobacter sp.]
MFKIVRNLFALGLLLVNCWLMAQNPGDLAVIGFNADGNDDLAIVALAELPANTTIYLRDDEWGGAAFRDAAESSYAWNTGTAVIPAGTVIVFSDITNGPTTNVGTIVPVNANNRGVGASDEAIFFYLGTDVNTPTRFLFAVSNGTVAAAMGTLDGTGLVAGNTALVLRSGTDIGQYKGPRTGTNKEGYLAAINDVMVNWDLQDASGDQTADNTAPDLPFNATPFVLGAAGADTNPPVVTSANLVNGTTIDVLVNEGITRASATNSANYVLTPTLSINNITYDSVGRKITLTTASTLSNGVTYRLSVNGLVDLAPAANTMSIAYTSGPLLWNTYTGQDLVITEIMYNAGSGADSLEFIEIYNKGNATISLGGLRISRSITGVIAEQNLAAKGVFLIAGDSLRAGRFYGKKFQQWASGFLGNGGAAIVISNSLGAIVDTVNYDDAAPWPTAPDGTGPSLELIDAATDNNVGTNWRASTTATGKTYNNVAISASPGVFNTPTAATVNFSVRSQSVVETSNSVTVTLSLSGTGSTAGTIEAYVSSGSAQKGTDYTFNDTTLTIPPGTVATPITFSIKINNDDLEESDEYFVLRFRNAQGVQLAAGAAQVVYIRDNDTKAPVATDSLELQLLSSFRNTGGSSEIVAFDPGSKRIFIANSVAGRIDIVDIANPASPKTIRQVSVTALGGINSIAAKNGLIAAAIESSVVDGNGKVIFIDTAGAILKEVSVGVLPDHIGFSPDGKFVLTANEGQPSDDYSKDPEGTISIIDISGGIATLDQSKVSAVGFADLNPFLGVYRQAGLRVFGVKTGQAGGSTLAQDLEPEYITFSPDSKTAYVTLQENNAVAAIDLTTKQLATIQGLPALRPLGFKNHNTLGNGLDASDQSAGANLANLPVYGVYMPDAIASFTAGGKNYLITANEGDAREYSALTEETTIKGIRLEPTVFPDSNDLRLDHLLGRLAITGASGDLDGDGDYDQIHVLGARSITIWDDQGALVWDSGDQLERITRDHPFYGQMFNANNGTSAAAKNRSDNKGPEPEGVATAVINNKPYAFIALERIGGVMVYDLSNPLAPKFVTYANNRAFPANNATDDRGSEGIIFVSDKESPNGKALVLVANETSNSVSIFQVNDKTRVTTSTKDLARPAVSFKVYPNPAQDHLYFSKVLSGNVYNTLGQWVRRFQKVDQIDLHGFERGMYVLQADNGEAIRFIVE